MAKLSMNEMTTFSWSFEEDVRNYAAAGIPAIGVWRQKLSDFGEEKGAELLKDANLEASSLLWGGGFTGCDGRSHKESIIDAQEAIRTAALLGAQSLVVYSGSRSGHTRNHARRLLKIALSELAPLAAESDVLLAIEPMHVGCALDWTFLTDWAETLALLEDISSDQVKLVFDTYQLGHDREIIARLPDIVRHIALVQLGDAKHPPEGEQDRCLLGEGTLPLQEIFAALSDLGYDGYYEVELMGQEIEPLDNQELLQQSMRSFEGLLGASKAS